MSVASIRNMRRQSLTSCGSSQDSQSSPVTIASVSSDQLANEFVACEVQRHNKHAKVFSLDGMSTVSANNMGTMSRAANTFDYVPQMPKNDGLVLLSNGNIHPEDDFGNFNNMVEKFKSILRDNNTQAISVKQLRHYIPMLLMATYESRAEPMLKKVKGMWTSPPDGWPEEIPFCDPNNGQKVHGKPRKEELLKMFQYLLKLYTEIELTNKRSQPTASNMATNHAYQTARNFEGSRQGVFELQNGQQISNVIDSNGMTTLTVLKNARADFTTFMPSKPSTASQLSARTPQERDESHFQPPPSNQVPKSSQQDRSYFENRTLHALLTSPRPDNIPRFKRSDSCPYAKDESFLLSKNESIASAHGNGIILRKNDCCVSNAYSHFNGNHEEFSMKNVSGVQKRFSQNPARSNSESAIPTSKLKSIFTETDRTSTSRKSGQISDCFQIDSSNTLESTISSKLLKMFSDVDSTTHSANTKTYTTKKSRIFDQFYQNKEIEEKTVEGNTFGTSASNGVNDTYLASSPSAGDIRPMDTNHQEVFSSDSSNHLRYQSTSNHCKLSNESSLTQHDIHPKVPSNRKPDMKDIEEHSAHNLKSRKSKEPIETTPNLHRKSISALLPLNGYEHKLNERCTLKNRKRAYSDSCLYMPKLSHLLSATGELNSISKKDIIIELATRIMNKMNTINHLASLDDHDNQILMTVFGLLTRSEAVKAENLKWLNAIHAFENTLDTVILLGHLPKKHILQWQKYTVACLLQGYENVNIDFHVNTNIKHL